MTQLIVIDKQTSKILTAKEILEEVNRDRSEEWQPYNMADLFFSPLDLLDWLDPQFYTTEITNEI